MSVPVTDKPKKLNDYESSSERFPCFDRGFKFSCVVTKSGTSNYSKIQLKIQVTLDINVRYGGVDV
jgi:hypothetical protein